MNYPRAEAKYMPTFLFIYLRMNQFIIGPRVICSRDRMAVELHQPVKLQADHR